MFTNFPVSMITVLFEIEYARSNRIFVRETLGE